MTIPAYQSLMSPILTVTADGKEHSRAELIESLASQFKLSKEDKEVLLLNRRQSLFSNRVDWATTHLRKARALESLQKGRYRITDRGLRVLKEHPFDLNFKILEQFPEYKEFRQWERKEEPQMVHGTVYTSIGVTNLPEGSSASVSFAATTPRELLESTYLNLRDQLASDLLEQAKRCSPSFFEKLVVDLLVTMGYGGSFKDAGMAIGKSGDEGVDGLIKQDRLGLDTVYVQAKRWDKGTVGSPELQKFVGSLEGHHATKGVFITTSKFSDDAKRFLEKVTKTVILIDGEQLADLMIEHGIGVAEDTTYTVRKLDIDYFSEE